MKKYVSISLFVFWAIIVAIMVAGLTLYDRNKTPPPQTPAIKTLTSPVATKTPPIVTTPSPKPKPTPAPPAPPAQTQIVLTTSEVAKHQSASDCWLIINNKVYNVTSYLNFHPAGARAIIPYCGQDGTQAFDTKGGRGRPHSSQAQSILDNYLVGPLVN